MIITVPNLSKEQREALLVEVQSWKDNPNLAYPRIISIKPKGRKIEIDTSDSFKVVQMVRKRGFDIE